ncbi:MAG: hypothetical protein KA886_10095 [Candidatus Cloacimonetes bacterium]|nr:hypothetical protein [Candidatus Cloacimonadota bacterium]
MHHFIIIFLILLPYYLMAQDVSPVNTSETINTNEPSAQLIISSVEFKGNIRYPADVLLKTIKTRKGDRLDNQTLMDDRMRLIQFYDSKDMHFTVVFYPEKIPVSSQQVQIIFQIHEKEIPFIQNLHFQGNNYLSDQKIKQFIYFKPNQFSVKDIESIKQKIIDIYLSRAFLFCEVKFDSLSIRDSLLTACFQIREHQQVKFSNALFTGNKISKANSIIRMSKIKKDKLISPDMLKTAENSLNSKDYLEDCSIIPINPETLLFNIKESKMTRIEGVLSFNQNQKNSFIGFFNFDFLNLFGSDRNLNFKWQSSQNNQKYVRMKYADPGPSGIPLAFNLSFEREEVDSSYIEINTDIDFYTYFDKHQIGLLLGLKDINPGSRKLNKFDKSTQKKTGLFWSYITLDYPANPSSGMSLLYKHILSFSNQSILSNDVESNTKQNIKRQSNEFSFAFIKPLTLNLIYYSSMNIRIIQNKSLYSYDLYSVGGTFSVRGFPEKFFSGNQIFWLNNELRLLTNRDSRFFIFVDYAYIDDERPSINITFKDVVGYGAGLRLLTKAGILRMDYGLHYFQNTWTSPMEGYIHLGIETSF